MNTMASIIITTFQRAHLLEWNLYSLAKQNIPFTFETIVVNDGFMDDTERICQKYQQKLNIRYIFSGQRNLSGELKWRVPGFAFNIGVMQSSGSVLILSCAEMYHIGDTILQLIKPITENNTLITLPIGKDDRDGLFLNMVQSNLGECKPEIFNNYPDLNVYLPFLIAISKSHFMAIHGYDEDFTGIAFDDNDLIDRLQAYGCRFYKTDARVVHLYHPRYMYQVGQCPEWYYNKGLYETRRGQIVRNLAREWGKL